MNQVKIRKNYESFLISRIIKEKFLKLLIGGMIMSRIFSILLVGVGGYYLFKKRFRLLNVILSNGFIRRLAVRSFMSIPAIRNRMMGTIFSQDPNPA